MWKNELVSIGKDKDNFKTNIFTFSYLTSEVIYKVWY